MYIKIKFREGIIMALITDHERDVIEKEIYLPMLITILERDKKAIELSQVKIKQPYIELIENAIKKVNKDIRENRIYMNKNKIKVFKVNGDEVFTKYRFICRGINEDHNYFNPRLKNRCEELLSEYLSPSD